jgi:hypothetical protein
MIRSDIFFRNMVQPPPYEAFLEINFILYQFYTEEVMNVNRIMVRAKVTGSIIKINLTETLRFVAFRFVSFRLVPFRFDSFRFASFCFNWFCFVSTGFVWF